MSSEKTSVSHASSLVDTKFGIQSTQLLRPAPLLTKPSTIPFFTLYPVFANIYYNHYDEYIVGSEWTFVYLIALFSLHALLFLVPHWNININSKFNYQAVKSIDEASHILIHPLPNRGVGAITKINRVVHSEKEVQTTFVFQQRRFLYDITANRFAPPEFLIDCNPTIKQFKHSKGLNNAEKIENDLKLYGENKFDIPIPSFLELFKEHAVAPFFVFQVFCVALWVMDDSWYYSLFSLFMLVSFEFTTVFQRRGTMNEFRSMGIKPFDIYVHRVNKWVKMKTNELLPGDLVSIIRNTDENAVPCDLVLIDGTAIVNEAMLSGESTPLLKESIKLRPDHEVFDADGIDKNAILHGGTKVLQITPPAEKAIVSRPPDDGALAIVSKTGFETSQGSLVRVMIFSSERISVGNKESLYFILFLLVFAIAASKYVWDEGTRMGRKQSKLILDCILIVTSVVPPELPMELTMAVNNSLSALGKFYIYCTEPFRIPLAGRIDVCCFDKTGTLTGEDLVFEGLAGFSSDNIRHLYKCFDEKVPAVTNYVLGSAHALVRLDDGELVGDPMEQATLKASGWKLSDSKKNIVERDIRFLTKNNVVDKKDTEKFSNDKIKILRRFQFSSALKRSSTISSISNTGKTLVSVKGAPETIRGRLIEVPSNYEDVYKSYTRSGSRVLALAYKYLDDRIPVNSLNRDDVETKLHFAGFIVFHCPMKPDAIETIEMLNNSSHRCIMITGDNPLTAVHVAKEVKIVEREVFILDSSEDYDHINESLVWRDVNETKIIPMNADSEIDEALFKENDICITGYALSKLLEHKQLKSLLRHTWVYARTSPVQKEFLINSYKNMGYNTLMCGDGTNDVGALKQAHVGIALLNGTEEGMKKLQENRKIQAMQKVYESQKSMMMRWNQPPPPVPEAIAFLYPPGPKNPHYIKAMEKRGVEISDEQKAEIAVTMAAAPVVPNANSAPTGGIADQLMGSLREMEEEEEAPTLKLGDASVAAPFTSKLSSVATVTNVIRQGRCALVSTIQMYKILALNCLISAYSLSVIYLAGVKFGDGQATASGILLSVCFLSISKGKPLQTLSKERPQPGIFNIYIMGSILGQFAVHIFFLIYITREIYKLEPREPKPDLEKEFVPSLLNTGIFLIQLIQQVSTFAVNYIGNPFKENIRDNKGMYYGILGVACLAFAGSTEFIPELNEGIQFVKMSDEFKFKLTGSMILDYSLAWVVEAVLKYYFMDSKAADIALRD
ncbi:ion-transporting P-type ATPase [Saccharomycopsis crataegensis]|uniref:Ion-transporting P-type ATPase n=1 Tax=Saccharomycopsis crataegensis TaxID=43959 RepID=A0AAV5QEF8_9ASCO|nr:ion-transporting P-type ATPase [Saccharomycopsis crataegensis]